MDSWLRRRRRPPARVPSHRPSHAGSGLGRRSPTPGPGFESPSESAWSTITVTVTLLACQWEDWLSDSWCRARRPRRARERPWWLSLAVSDSPASGRDSEGVPQSPAAAMRPGRDPGSPGPWRATEPQGGNYASVTVTVACHSAERPGAWARSGHRRPRAAARGQTARQRPGLPAACAKNESQSLCRQPEHQQLESLEEPVGSAYFCMFWCNLNFLHCILVLHISIHACFVFIVKETWNVGLHYLSPICDENKCQLVKTDSKSTWWSTPWHFHWLADKSCQKTSFQVWPSHYCKNPALQASKAQLELQTKTAFPVGNPSRISWLAEEHSQLTWSWKISSSMDTNLGMLGKISSTSKIKDIQGYPSDETGFMIIFSILHLKDITGLTSYLIFCLTLYLIFFSVCTDICCIYEISLVYLHIIWDILCIFIIWSILMLEVQVGLPRSRWATEPD